LPSVLFQGIFRNGGNTLKNVPEFAELSEDQKRQYIDADAVFSALCTAEDEAWRHRGSMFWREQAGRQYLIRMSPDSRQKLLAAV
jgi:hypothetical protein